MSDNIELNLDHFIESLKSGRLLNYIEIKFICEEAKKIFKEEQNVINLSTPLTICGNIKGQFNNLLEIFKISGDIPETNYLFLGGYSNSLEAISLLFCLKVRYPKRITLLRGLNEDFAYCQYYGFYEEAKRKYGNEEIFKIICEVFNYIPLAAIINNKVFCVYGGLSPDLETIEEINKIDRFVYIDKNDNILGLIINSPVEYSYWEYLYFYNINNGWIQAPKGRDYYFLEEVTERFEKKNQIDLIICGGQYMEDGFRFFHNNKLISLFSAPNVGINKNKGAIIEIDENMEKRFLIINKSKIKRNKNNLRIPDYFVLQ
jgi:diadenosine tetraphosphatase ApaH/serine/threonine PP2A family protein phosphatase